MGIQFPFNDGTISIHHRIVPKVGLTWATGSRNLTFAFLRILNQQYEGVYSSSPTTLTAPPPVVMYSYLGYLDMRNAAAPQDQHQRPALFIFYKYSMNYASIIIQREGKIK